MPETPFHGAMFQSPVSRPVCLEPDDGKEQSICPEPSPVGRFGTHRSCDPFTSFRPVGSTGPRNVLYQCWIERSTVEDEILERKHPAVEQCFPGFQTLITHALALTFFVFFFFFSEMIHFHGDQDEMQGVNVVWHLLQLKQQAECSNHRVYGTKLEPVENFFLFADLL